MSRHYAGQIKKEVQAGRVEGSFVKQLSATFAKFDAAVKMVQRLGNGALLDKADIKSAFKLITISQDDFRILGFRFDSQYYFDKSLPFGCSISCATFELCG